MRGVALLMSENTTVIGLPHGIRDYGNEALFYSIRGEGGGFYFLDAARGHAASCCAAWTASSPGR